MWRRDREAAERAAERRRVEDAAPRLAALVPQIESLRLEVQESRASIANPEATHIRRVQVAHAPAMFIVPCHDSHCKEGGHDVTREVMIALRSRQARFEGEDACQGSVGSGHCERVLRYVGVATYRD
jgi:hypothetical protein